MANKTDRVQISAEEFVNIYGEIYTEQFDPEIGTTHATYQDVADRLAMNVNNVAQKVRNLNEKLGKAGLPLLPTMRTSDSVREGKRLDLSKIALIAAGLNARKNLDQLD